VAGAVDESRGIYRCPDGLAEFIHEQSSTSEEFAIELRVQSNTKSSSIRASSTRDPRG
jgi:hypothetical protein